MTENQYDENNTLKILFRLGMMGLVIIILAVGYIQFGVYCDEHNGVAMELWNPNVCMNFMCMNMFALFSIVLGVYDLFIVLDNGDSIGASMGFFMCFGMLVITLIVNCLSVYSGEVNHDSLCVSVNNLNNYYLNVENYNVYT